MEEDRSLTLKLKPEVVIRLSCCHYPWFLLFTGEQKDYGCVLEEYTNLKVHFLGSYLDLFNFE